MTTLEEQLHRKTSQLAAIREISQAIAEAKDLDSTLHLIATRTTEVMRVDSCSIYLYDDVGESLVLQATTGLRRDSIGRAFLPCGEGITGWAAEHRQVAAVRDAATDTRFYRVIGSGESRFASLMATPLVNRDKVIGAANVQTKTHRQFTADEIELFQFIAELAAIAIEKAQLVHRASVQEMHHRVKNNLQTVAMLLRLQVGYPNITPQDVLHETINRVLSIATVHEILSESGHDELGLLGLIQRLAQTIGANMTNPHARINITVSGDNVQMSTQNATSLALVANELIQNALEHGLPNGRGGEIKVSLTRHAGGLRMVVQDNGQGLRDDFDIDADLGLGLEIARTTITEDMNGTFDIQSIKGTRVIVWIPT